jgi:hypothetical protein
MDLPADELGPAPSPAPAGPGETVYPQFGMRTTLAPSASPAIDRGSVMAVAAVRDAVAHAAGEPDVELCLVTTGDFGPGQPDPVQRLGWVLTWHGTAPLYRGLRGPPPPNPPVCDYLIVVDANTGEHILVGQICPGT